MVNEISKLNIKKENIEIKLTEWELDIVAQAVKLAQFPGSVTFLATRLITKLEEKLNAISSQNKE